MYSTYLFSLLSKQELTEKKYQAESTIRELRTRLSGIEEVHK